MLHKTKSFYFKEKFVENTKNFKEFWKTMKSLGLTL